MRTMPFNSQPVRSAFFIFFLLFFSQCVHASTARETIKKTLPFIQGGFLSLSNTNGDVQVTAWEKNEVEIVAYKEVRADNNKTAEKLLKQLLVEIHEREGEIIIETKYPQHSGNDSFFGWLFGNGGTSYSVQYEIKVPRQIDVNLSTTNGNVEVEEINGRLKLNSTNGQISGTEISGLTRCHTTNGSIKIDFRNIEGDEKMSFKSTNGSIKLYLPDDFSAEVELKTTNGKINCDFPAEGRMSRTRFSGEIGDSHQKLYCRTTNGNIGLYIR